MWLPRICTLLIIFGLVSCEKTEDEETSSAFLEVAKTFFANKDNVEGLQGIASAFVQSDMGKQVGEIFTGGKSNLDGMGQMLSGLGSLISNNHNQPGIDSMLGTLVNTFVQPEKVNTRSTRDAEDKEEAGIDLENVLNVGSMLLGQNGNTDLLMGLAPMLLQGLAGGDNKEPTKKHDHSGHSWYLPPILETIHVMWDHFSSSEFGQALWKNSGLSKIIAQMSDPQGRIQYEKILDSFESPALRRRWIKSLTNYIAEWISHISDPMIQQRYLTTAQFVGNSFLKSQGYPKVAMFDANRPAESFSRLVNAVAKRHLGMKIDSSLYVKSAVAYVQELIALASEKGFIMSRVNARELSNRLSDMINNDIIDPVLKAYRAYKWSLKSPQCASQILCTINDDSTDNKNTLLPVRRILQKLASFPAAWAASNKLGVHFWTLYGAIMDNGRCAEKYPADCTAFYEEELRVTTESTHTEL